MRILILILLSLSLHAKAQNTYVVLNIDSGAHVDTIIGYSGNPFWSQAHGSKGYHNAPAQWNNYLPSYQVHAGFPPKGIYPKISVIASRQFDPAQWWTYGIVFQMTIHGPFMPNHAPSVARWYGNVFFANAGTLYPSPTGPNYFSGEGASYVMCSSDSSDIKHIQIKFNDIIY